MLRASLCTVLVLAACSGENEPAATSAGVGGGTGPSAGTSAGTAGGTGGPLDGGLCGDLAQCGIVEVRPACAGPGDDAPCAGGGSYAMACLTACCRFGEPAYECAPASIQGGACTADVDCARDSGLCCLSNLCTPVPGGVCLDGGASAAP